MKALQLHYTSCRRGQSGSAGFQTRTLSPGIRPDEQREIERRGVYRPPRNTRPDPGEEEIARDFPRALRSYPLDSGRQAVTRAGYVGRDYSGRWGNFFAHTLVLENGELPVPWPIDLYEWAGWKEGLKLEEDTEEAPAPLPAVDLGSFVAADSFGLEELASFLREAPGRVELLARMGRAVLLGRESSRALVVRDTPLNGLYWIACLQKILPPLHAAALSASTYQDDPRGCADLNATTGETDFTFDEAERRYRFFEFDLTTGVSSEVPDSADDYPAVAARWMSEDPERLGRFYTFFRLFDHREPEPALIFALRLFELSESDAAAPGGDQLAGMIAFASRHARPEGRIALLEALGRAVDLPCGLPRAEDYDPLIRFLASGARETGRPEHRSLVFRAWASLLRSHLLARGSGLAAAEASWSYLRREMGTYLAELAAIVLAEPVWRDPGSTLARLSTEALVFLLRATWASLELARRLPPWEQGEAQAILASLAAPGRDLIATSQAVLSAVPQEAEPLLTVSRRLRDLLVGGGVERRNASAGIGRALGQSLAPLEPAAAALIRGRLEGDGEWDLLFGEWLQLADHSESPESAFAAYRKSVLARLPRYEEIGFPWIAGSLLQRLPAERQSALAVDWLRGGEIQRLPAELAVGCVAHANRKVSLDPKDRGGDETAQLVSEAAHRYRVALRPDRSLLRRALVAVGTPGGNSRDLSLESLRSSLSELSAEEHGAFLDEFLLPALEKVGSQREHQQVLLAAAGNRPELLGQRYLTFFKARRKASWPESLHGALRFWLSLESSSAPTGGGDMSVLEKDGRAGLLLALEKLKPEELAGVEEKLRRARIEGTARRRWQEMVASLQARKRNPLRRLAGLFRR